MKENDIILVIRLNMQKRTLGKQGLEASALGLGCMGMSWAYGPSDEIEALKVLPRALELGINFWDTAEIYGPYINEELLGKALKHIPRENIILATKFGFKFNDKNERIGLDSSPAHIKNTIEGSLKRLGTDYIDLYYQHRLDPHTPIEDTVGVLSDLVKAGKVRYIGLCEVGPGTIRRAHKVHPLSVIQSEYSLWERGIEESVLPAVKELGIGLVPYSPLGRGFLSGKIQSPNDLDENDWRRQAPRFQKENMEHNLKLVAILKEMAAKHEVTPAQIALAWLLKQSPYIVPIPGTKHIKYLEENSRAVTIELPPATWASLDETLKGFTIAGLRYNEENMKTIDTTK